MLQQEEIVAIDLANVIKMIEIRPYESLKDTFKHWTTQITDEIYHVLLCF